jgi:hypothetical protein
MEKKPVKPGTPPAGGGVSRAEIIVAALLILVIIVIFLSMSDLSSGPLAPLGLFFTTVISAIKTFSTIFSMLAILVIIIASINIIEISKEENKKLGLTLSWENERDQKNTRWRKIEEYMTSLNPSDWKIAILEADNILDEITERMGYHGATLGDRMKTISATDFPYLEDAWEAHKIRNAIAHKGTDYLISRSDAEHVVNIYYRIFSSLGYL